ncbi:MAG: zinc metalloprotease HtpX [Actinomycetota bacterium]|nr:zinc metalloprotease HtpX [Actinomycetota bacterium]
MYEQIASNVRKSWFLILLFVVLIMLLGYVFGELMRIGYFGVALALIIAMVMSFSGYYYSDKIVLTMSRARPVEKEEYPYLYNVVEGLSIAAGNPTPKMYVIDDSAPNAFATGRDPEHSAVAVTTGLLEKLNRVELEGVIAHEISHIQNYDIRLATLTAVMVGVVVLLSDWLLRSFWWGGRRRDSERGALTAVLLLIGIILALLSPLIAQLIRLAISRRREFLADASGAMLTRYPPGLASALEKLAADRELLEVANKATAHLYIVNPLKDLRGAMNSLFNTHPPIEERIKRLREMSFELQTE